VEAILPSRFQPGLTRAAEIICLKCLEKAPARRYSTAEALAEDLHRFRAGESILAHPAPPWEQAWRWTRRRPAVAAALAVAVAAIALLLGGGAYYNARLRQEASKARAAQAAAVAQRNLALNAFDHLVYDLQERLGDRVATRTARRSLLDTAIKGLDEIALGTEGSAPDLSRAVAHQKLGAIYRQIGRLDEARRQLDSARRLAESLAASAPGDLAVAECLRDALAGLGAIGVHDRQYAQAKQLLQRVVVLAGQIFGRDPRREGARRGLIEAHLELGRAHGFGGDRTAAEACYRTMHDLAQRWVDDEPASLPARDLLATSYRKLADERKLVADFPAARAHYQQAIAIDRKVLASEPDNFVFKRHLAVATDDLAGVAQYQGQVAEARALYAESQRLFTEQAAVDPEDFETRFRLGHVEARWGRLERDELAFDRAAELFKSALKRHQPLDPESPEATSRSRAQELAMLKAEIGACEVAARAVAESDFALSRPAAEACLLLSIRARAMARASRESDALAAAAALCDLAPDREATSVYLLAQALSVCVRLLDDSRWPGAPNPGRDALRQQCTDRAIASLTLAIDRGLENVPSSAFQETLAPLRGHPGARKLADRLREPPAPFEPLAPGEQAPGDTHTARQPAERFEAP
jgi:tetratricopeptide (TPR) repeat protein